MKSYLTRFILLLLPFPLFGAEYVLPAANQGGWSNVGVPGGIGQYLAGGVNDRAVTGAVINITAPPYNADNTGVADCQPALVAALAAAGENTVIYFPAGTYRFTTGFIYLNYKDNITIRGAGPGVTTFNLSLAGGNTPFLIWNSPGDFENGSQTISGTKTKGTAQLTVPSTSGFTIGEL